MKKIEAEALVTATFNQAYNEDRFRYFIKNLFHNYTSLTESALTGQYIFEAFREGIVAYKRLGKFSDPAGLALDVLAVRVKNRHALENARAMQRNFVARYLNGKERDAALVAFYSEDSEDWRFSLVRLDYSLDEQNNKVTKDLTPARRYSFLVGSGEKTHTAGSQLSTILQAERAISLAELENAFNIESVTKEFFEQYKKLYLRLTDSLDRHLEKDATTRAEFDLKGVQTADFAKRLLGQIVFLYFLQKKGWLGVGRGKAWGSGPKDFLQQLYAKKFGSYQNFFNDILEPLFYEALATERADNFYQGFNCRIPFLNGGLFEAIRGYDWVNTDILLDNGLFEEIFKVFDLYNFTVREDEPLDKEVAVDPEMLGKVFENLIPENERKGSGTYYTPREIVHYMCQESLINYLDAKLNIQQQPVQDQPQPSLFPEFARIDLFTAYQDVYVERVPRGDLAEFIYNGDAAQEHEATAGLKNRNGDYSGIYQYKIPESIRNQAQAIDEALAGVKVCDPAIGSGAFPVGLMNEIVRARLALNAYLGGADRRAYEFKRHAIQESIYGVDLEPSAVDIAKLRLWLSLVVDEDDFGNIQPLPNLDYKIVAGNSLLGFPFDATGRTEKLRKLTPLKEQFFDAYSPSRKAALRAKINDIINSEYNNPQTEKSIGYRVNFDFRWSFFEVFEQRGGFDIVIANPPYVDSEKMVRTDKDYRELLKTIYSSAKGNWDLFVVFIEKGMLLLNNHGTLFYITPNKLIGASYAEAIRELIATQTICEVRDYSRVNVFTTADVYPVVTGLTKYDSKRETHLVTMSSITQVMSHVTVTNDTLRQDNYWDKYFGTQDEIELLLKLKSFKTLGESVEGITAAATVNEAYLVKEVVLEEADCKLENYFKLINTGTIDAYKSLWGVNYTQYIKGKYKKPVVSSYDLKKINNRRNEQASSPKLIIAGMSKSIECYFDSKGEYLAGKSTSIILDSSSDKLAYVCGILNSKLLGFWLNKSFNSLKMAGGYINVGNGEIKQVPFKPYNAITEGKRIAELVKDAHQTNDNANLKTLIPKIDQLVYQLYGLTPEEIAIVEGLS